MPCGRQLLLLLPKSITAAFITELDHLWPHVVYNCRLDCHCMAFGDSCEVPACMSTC